MVDTPSHDAPQQPGRLSRMWLAVTRTFFKGLIAILPIAATVYVLGWLANILDAPGRNFINWVLARFHIKEYGGGWGTGLLSGVVVIFVIGLLINAWVVKQILNASESLLQKVPLAKTVFSSVRDLMGFFSKSNKEPAGQVVAVEFPGGTKMIGFITRQNLSDLPIGPEAGEMAAVYIPYSYAVGGVTLLVPRANIKPIDMSAEAAMRFAITAGMKKADKRQ